MLVLCPAPENFPQTLKNCNKREHSSKSTQYEPLEHFQILQYHHQKKQYHLTLIAFVVMWAIVASGNQIKAQDGKMYKNFVIKKKMS